VRLPPYQNTPRTGIRRDGMSGAGPDGLLPGRDLATSVKGKKGQSLVGKRGLPPFLHGIRGERFATMLTVKQIRRRAISGARAIA